MIKTALTTAFLISLTAYSAELVILPGETILAGHDKVRCEAATEKEARHFIRMSHEQLFVALKTGKVGNCSVTSRSYEIGRSAWACEYRIHDSNIPIATVTDWFAEKDCFSKYADAPRDVSEKLRHLLRNGSCF